MQRTTCMIRFPQPWDFRAGDCCTGSRTTLKSTMTGRWFLLKLRLCWGQHGPNVKENCKSYFYYQVQQVEFSSLCLHSIFLTVCFILQLDKMEGEAGAGGGSSYDHLFKLVLIGDSGVGKVGSYAFWRYI
jgi:hypothetical protein